MGRDESSLQRLLLKGWAAGRKQLEARSREFDRLIVAIRKVLDAASEA